MRHYCKDMHLGPGSVVKTAQASAAATAATAASVADFPSNMNGGEPTFHTNLCEIIYQSYRIYWPVDIPQWFPDQMLRKPAITRVPYRTWRSRSGRCSAR